MALHQERSLKKPSGGHLRRFRKKRLGQLARQPALTKIGERKITLVRARGGSIKPRLYHENMANVLDKTTNSCKKVKILNTTQNPANRHFVRRNIMTKGGIIDTELGKARIISRPGQDGVINAVLLK